MSKSLKKILVTGASLLMFASVGAGASSMNAHASVIVYPSQYRMIKHARGIRGTGMPHARVKAFGDNETSGYVRGHRIIIGNDGTVLSISGRRPTRAMFNSLFHHHVARRHYRRPVRRHIAKRTHRKAVKRNRRVIRKHSVKRAKSQNTIRPVSAPSWLNGYWIRDDSTDMHVTGFHAKNYRASQQRYWQIRKNGRDVSYIESPDFANSGSHVTYRHGSYIKNGQRPYAITYYQPTGKNRMRIGVSMKARGHNSIKKFRGSYYKVSHRHFQDISNGLDSVNHYQF